MFVVAFILGMLTPGPLGSDVAVAAGSVIRSACVVGSAWLAPRPRSAASVSGISRNVIVATGYGRPPKRLQGARARMMARRAAEVVAVRNLARKLGFSHPVRIRGFRYAHTSYHADGSVSVTVEYRRP